jgi:ADP-ribosyl-[dinitrogen reductase] hydrolase
MPDRKAQHHDPSTTPAHPLTKERSARTRSGAPASAAAARTSATDPLRVDEVAAPPGGGGRIGMTFCPGKRQQGAAMGDWERDLAADLARIAGWGAAAIATLMEPHELERYGVPGLGDAVEALGMEWHHLPIPDVGVPDSLFEARWFYAGHRLRTHLLAGRRVLLHCRGGLGRTGTLAARLLVELGTAPGHAVAAVRRARPGCIETTAQEAYALAVEAVGAAQAASTDRLLGGMLGGALGDAFGYAVEFDSLEAIRRRFGPEGIREPVFHAGHLVVSDDTQMTLFTLEGLGRAVGPDGSWIEDGVVAEVRRAYLDWLDTQSGSTAAQLTGALASRPAMRHRRAPGNTCLTALRAGGRGEIGRPINGSKGCGAAMRSAPVAFLPGLPAGPEAFRIGAWTGALTHGHPDGWGPAGLVVAAVRRLLDGEGIRDALLGAIGDLEGAAAAWDGAVPPTTAPYLRALELAERMPERPVEAIARLGLGWTGEEAVAIAAYAALTGGGSFEDVVARAANHDGDSDSTASIAGQLWGAAHGAGALPHAWVRRLDVLDELLCLAASLRALQPVSA